MHEETEPTSSVQRVDKKNDKAGEKILDGKSINEENISINKKDAKGSLREANL